jgi:type IV pilus assembly protein PilY1
MRTPRTFRLVLLGAAAAAFLAPYAADSGTCATDQAAMDLLATSWADTQLNGPKGEDTAFFTSKGGVPNIMVLIDTTGSMNRLPPDGPNYYGAALPPGYYDGAADQTAAYAANATTTVPRYTASTAWTSPTPNTRIVGCGLDSVSAASTAFTSSAMYQTLMNRRFYPPCGTAVDPTLVGAGFKNQATDYAAQMTVCPYFTPSNSQAIGAPGFDPDYYSATDPMATSAGSKTNFFGKDLIFHDNPDMAAAWTRNATLPFGHDFGGGFYYNGVAPHLDKASGAKSTIATFCAQQGTATPQLQGGRSHSDICNECLTNRGWYYDGVIYQAGENAAPTPSIWYTGNYLSFFPPKFLIARKVLKDIIAVQSRIRMAMATFAGSGATFVQPFNPSCGMPDNSSFDSNRASYVSSVDGWTFSGGTPMATALFDVGRYYHSPDLPWFGTKWEDAKGESAGTANQYAVCYACQSSNVILITDGQPSWGDGSGLPPGGLTAADVAGGKKAGDGSTGICGISDAVCPECKAFTKSASPTCGTSAADPEAYKDSLAKVAFYLHNLDLRKDNETTLDCKGNGGKQALDTYTIGFATGANASIATILGSAAKAGGGIYIPAENTQALKEGFFSILEQINGRSTSFSVATVSTLQTTEGSEVLVPRFSPAKSAHWPGHLYRYQLYSEFVRGCTPKGTDDYDCDGRCEGAFLEDKDGDFISEDANGIFQKNNPAKAAICAQVPACGGTGCAAAGSALANHFWDAMFAWHDKPVRAWKQRNVYTVVDNNVVNGDGVFNDQDKPFKLDASTDAAAKMILPYLALGGGAICNQVSARFVTAGDLASATLVAGNQVECAKSIIRYVLGADLFNERGIKDGSYPPASQEDAIDREFLLGDIFHSSPVVVSPPLELESRVCMLGLSKQCLLALWDTDTPKGKEAYALYRAAYASRKSMVLVGANDGMLHAFDNDGYEDGGKGYTSELWAFIPPDLLPKLPLLLGTEHHLFVDGNPMVRDVWVDGTGNGRLLSGGRNDIKEPGEFHTVAVVGERRGGTRYFALDVTDAAEPATTWNKAPRLLWLYPQPGAKESLTFAETYNEYLPTPPPIGPVRVATGGLQYPTHGDSPKYSYDSSNTPFHETWVAFLNGGYDPQYVRGRGVHMVDVWWGNEIFDFSYPDDPATVSADDPRLALRFPVAGVVGMSRWGEADAMKDIFQPTDNYFDTATFGDTGGQLWTLRFHEPAKLDTNGRATNWFGARLLQMTTGTAPANCKYCGGQPFFYITANGPTPSLRYYRVYAGTGDRFNLTDTLGGTCSPTNLRACVLRGCTVTVTQAGNLLSAPAAGFTQRGMSAVACADLTSTQLDGTTTSCTMAGHAKVEISCTPEKGEPGTTVREASVACTSLADGYSCSRPINTTGRSLALTLVQPDLGNWFFSLRAFRSGADTDPETRPLFKTAAGAKIYDSHRMWLRQSMASRTASPGVTLIDSTIETTTNVATEDSNGWAMYYNHAPTVVVEGIPVTVDWRDERSSSGTLLGNKIVAWNALQPALGMADTTSTGTCRLSRCTQENRRVNYLYAADPVSGGVSPLFKDSGGNVIRSMKTFRLVPAQALQLTYFVDKRGRVQPAGTGVSTEQGAVNIGASEPEDPFTEAGSIIIDKELYQCRHARTPVCQ